MTHADAPRTIHVEYDLPQPPAKVWRALTEPALLAAWLMPNDFAPVVGHRFTFQAPPMHGWDGVVRCEVREVVLHQRLVYTWVGGAAASLLDSVVTWTLAPGADGGTQLTLEHAGFLPRNAFAFDAMGQGWRGKLAERIAAVIAAQA